MTVLISEETWGPEASLMPSSHSPPTHPGGLQLEEGAPGGGGRGLPAPGGWSGVRPRGSTHPPPPHQRQSLVPQFPWPVQRGP